MEKSKSRTLKQRVLGAATGVALGLASLLGGARADAAVININPITNPNYISIQNALDKAQPGDTVNISGELATLPYGNSFSLKSGTEGHLIDYFFNNALLNGSGVEHGSVLWIRGGGYLNMSGDLTINNAQYGIFVGDAGNPVAFNDVNIGKEGSRITLNVENNSANPDSGMGIWVEDIKHSSALTEAAVDVRYCIQENQGKKLIAFNSASTTANSPTISAINNTTRGLNRLMDVPKYWDGSTNIMLSGTAQAPIDKNILIGLTELCDENDYQYFSSPNNIGWMNVDYHDWGGTGNVELVEADFYDFANLIPLIGSNADGKGAIPAVPEPATLALLGLGAGALLIKRRKGESLEELLKKVA